MMELPLGTWTNIGLPTKVRSPTGLHWCRSEGTGVGTSRCSPFLRGPMPASAGCVVPTTQTSPSRTLAGGTVALLQEDSKAILARDEGTRSNPFLFVLLARHDLDDGLPGCTALLRSGGDPRHLGQPVLGSSAYTRGPSWALPEGQAQVFVAAYQGAL